jgi:hypothetical protein
MDEKVVNASFLGSAILEGPVSQTLIPPERRGVELDDRKR